jgi:hypothetical protein
MSASWTVRIIVTACCALTPAAADAATRYVATAAHGGNDNSGINTCTTKVAPCLTVQHAVDVASSGDTIQIGPGTFKEAVDATTKALTFIGAGSGTPTAFDPTTQTFIDATATTKPALTTGNHDVTVEQLRVRGGVNGPTAAAAIDGHGGASVPALDLSDVVVLQTSPPGASISPAAVVVGSNSAAANVSVTDSTVVGFLSGIHVVGSGGSLAITHTIVSTPAPPVALVLLGIAAVSTGVDTTIARSTLTGIVGVEQSAKSTVTVARTVIDASLSGVFLLDGGDGPVFTARDTVIAPAAGVLKTGVGVSAPAAPESQVPTLTLTFDTVLARDQPTATALDLTLAAAGTAVHTHNTILRSIDTSGGSGNNDIASGAQAINWDLQYTDYHFTAGVGIPAPGSGTNFDVLPHFVDDTGANLRLDSTSTLFDKGDPSIVNPGERDVTGAPRALAHTCGTAPLPDVGAFEAPAATGCPPPTATITTPANGATYTLGQTVNAAYTCAATAPATVAGCDGDVPAGQPIDTGTLGSHTFTVTATSSDGITATATSTYTVNPPVPSLGRVRASHKTFRTGAKLATIASRHKQKMPPVGTTFTFTLNTDATVKLAFTELTSGRKQHGKCVKQTKHNAHARKCTRSTSKGSLKLPAAQGADTITFQGRVSKSKKLKPGNYKVTFTATNSTGTSNSRSIKFTIAPG